MAAKAPHKIMCVDCERPYMTKQPKTKRCYMCQVLDTADHWGTRARECEWCDDEFYPTTGSMTKCPECHPRRGTFEVEGECKYCTWSPDAETQHFAEATPTDRQMHEDMKVCLMCFIEVDPKKHASIIRALAKKRKKIRGTD